MTGEEFWEAPVIISAELTVRELAKITGEARALDCYLEFAEMSFTTEGEANLTAAGWGDWNDFERLVDGTDGIRIDYDELAEWQSMEMGE